MAVKGWFALNNTLVWIIMTLIATLFFRYLWIIIPLVALVQYFRTHGKGFNRKIIITLSVVSAVSLVFFLVTQMMPKAENAVITLFRGIQLLVI